MKNISKPGLLSLLLPLPTLVEQNELLTILRAKRQQAAALRREAAATEAAAVTRVEAMILGNYIIIVC